MGRLQVMKFLQLEHLVFSLRETRGAHLERGTATKTNFNQCEIFIRISPVRRIYCNFSVQETNTCQLESNITDVKGCDFSMLYKTTQ